MKQTIHARDEDTGVSKKTCDLYTITIITNIISITNMVMPLMKRALKPAWKATRGKILDKF